MAKVLVTGANRGIGLELCRQLKQRGDEVIAVCRTSSLELDAIGVQVETNVDVASGKSVEELAQRLEGVELDLLTNNAGIFTRESIEDMNFNQIRKQFEVNSLGPLRVSISLLPKLKHGSKIGIITSRMGSIADNSSGSSYGYRMSKAAVNMAGVSLANDLRELGIAVAILHPGWVRTDMTDHNGLLETNESVPGLLARLDALSLEHSGMFWHSNGEILPW